MDQKYNPMINRILVITPLIIISDIENVAFGDNHSSGQLGNWMDPVDEVQSQISIRIDESGSTGDVHPDTRDMVLGGKRKAGCLSLTPTHTHSLSTTRLTYPNFNASPSSWKPQWMAFYRICRARAEYIQRLWNQQPTHFLTCLRRSEVQWRTSTALCAGPQVPLRSVKLFFRPLHPVSCEMMVQGTQTHGQIEGVECVSTQPLLRIHFSYPSPWRREELWQLKVSMIRSLPTLAQNKYLIQLIWGYVFPNKKSGQGFEFVSRLMRFGPGAHRTPRQCRPRPWNFTGVYEAIETTTCINTVHFMTKSARRDRTINHIRITNGSLDDF